MATLVSKAALPRTADRRAPEPLLGLAIAVTITAVFWVAVAARVAAYWGMTFATQDLVLMALVIGTIVGTALAPIFLMAKSDAEARADR